VSPRIESAAPAAPAALAIDAVDRPPQQPTPPTPHALQSLEGLPPARRAEVHAANLALRKGDLAEYQKYVDAFVAAHSLCRTIREAERFGEPASPPSGASPGASLPECYDYNGRYAGGADAAGHAAQKDAGDRIAAHRRRLRGEAAPLSFGASASAGASVTSGKSKYGVAIGAATDGTITAELTVGAGAPRVVLGGSPGAGKPVSREYAVGPVSITRRDGHPDRLEIDPTPASPFGFPVATDKQSVTLCGRLGGKLGSEGSKHAVTLEVEACVTANLTTPDVFREGVRTLLRTPERKGDE
jgi:hypothetical protein